MAHVDFHGPGWFPDTETSEPWDRALLIISVAGAGLSLLVLTITLVLRGVDGEDDTRVALAVGAPPAKMRRLRATEGVILAGLGAILALPLGWIPVTAVEVGEVRRSGVWTDAVTSRLHLPTWEVIPILLAPMVVAAVLWIVVPAGRALLRRRSVDTLLPRA